MVRTRRRTTSPVRKFFRKFLRKWSWLAPASGLGLLLALTQLGHDGGVSSAFLGARQPGSQIADTVCSNYLLLPREQIEVLLKRLEASGGDPGDIRRFSQLLADLSASSKIQFLDQWIRFVVVNHKQGIDLLNTFEELVEARRQIDLLRDDEVIEVGADESQANVPGKKSFDILIRSKADGSILRAIEVTTVREPVDRPQDIRSAVQHGADKSRGDPRGATAERREVSIALSLYCPTSAKGALSVNCPGPGIVTYVYPAGADGKLNIVTHDLLQTSIPEYLNAYREEDRIPLEVVTLVDRDSASVLAVYHQRRQSDGALRWVRAF